MLLGQLQRSVDNFVDSVFQCLVSRPLKNHMTELNLWLNRCNISVETSHVLSHNIQSCGVKHSALSPQALMNVNSRLRELYPDSEELFDIVLMTNNHAQVGVRLINSINHYGTLGPEPNIVDCLVLVYPLQQQQA